jgi:multiple sugar transport system substrate-binding protein
MKARHIMSGIAASAAVALLAACGSASGSDGGPSTVEYWLWQDDATDTTWTDLAADFNASHDDVQVNLTTIPLDQYQDRLLTAASSGTAPCAARSKDWWLGQFAPEGMLADITANVDAWDGKDDVIESLWDTGRLPGSDEVYMLPHQYVTMWLYYNKDLFAAAGVEPPTTQEEFLEAAVALTDPAAGKYAFDVRGGAGGQDQWIAWMFASGVDVVDADGEVVLDSPAAVKANDRYLSIVNELAAAPPGSNTAAFAQVQTNFAAGTTAMMIHHPGSLNAMREALGDALGVTAIPVAAGADPATLTSMSGNVVLDSCKDQDAAFEWISWLATEEPMREISTSIQGQLPVLESVATTDPFATDVDLQLAIDAARTAKSWPALPGVAQLAAKDYQTQVQIALQGDQTSEQMLAALVAVLEQD